MNGGPRARGIVRTPPAQADERAPGRSQGAGDERVNSGSAITRALGPPFDAAPFSDSAESNRLSEVMLTADPHFYHQGEYREPVTNRSIFKPVVSAQRQILVKKLPVVSAASTAGIGSETGPSKVRT